MVTRVTVKFLSVFSIADSLAHTCTDASPSPTTIDVGIDTVTSMAKKH